MSKVTIDNPVINSPFEEPQRHFKFTPRGITEDIVEGRRESEYFIPMPKPKKQPQARSNEASSPIQKFGKRTCLSTEYAPK